MAWATLALPPPVIVLWRCNALESVALPFEPALTLCEHSAAPATARRSSTLKRLRVAKCNPSTLWTPIQLDCFFVCLFHFGHTLPSQELICGLLQVTVWRWQTCPASPLTPPPPPLPSYPPVAWLSLPQVSPLVLAHGCHKFDFLMKNQCFECLPLLSPFKGENCLELFLHTSKLMCLVGLHYWRKINLSCFR